MGIQITPIPKLTLFAAPDFTLTTANAAGSAGVVTTVRTDASILAYDTTVPANITTGSASTGSAATSARRDHVHNAGTVDTNGLVLIGTATASSSSTLGITGLDSTYDTYLISGADLMPSVDAVFGLRFGDSSGIDSGSGDYSYALGTYLATSTSEAITATEDSTYIPLSATVGADSVEGFGCTVWITQPGDTSGKNRASGISTYNNGSSVLSGGVIFGGRNVNITLTQIQIFPASGNFASGRLSVWGYSHG